MPYISSHIIRTTPAEGGIVIVDILQSGSNPRIRETACLAPGAEQINYRNGT